MSKLHTITCMRSLEIDTGHCLFNHEGKCKNPHGHRYKFDIYCEPADGLDEVGRVVDFSVIKEVIGGWLDENWDHGMIICEHDPLAHLYKEWPNLIFEGEGESELVDGLERLRESKHSIVPFNPTAENLASYLKTKAKMLLVGTDVKVVKIVCHETPNCSAIAQ